MQKLHDQKTTGMLYGRTLPPLGKRILKQPLPQGNPASHWDLLLDEMEWMAISMYEEKKLKRTLAFAFAHEIAEKIKRKKKEKKRYELAHKIQACRLSAMVISGFQAAQLCETSIPVSIMTGVSEKEQKLHPYMQKTLKQFGEQIPPKEMSVYQKKVKKLSEKIKKVDTKLQKLKDLRINKNDVLFEDHQKFKEQDDESGLEDEDVIYRLHLGGFELEQEQEQEEEEKEEKEENEEKEEEEDEFFEHSGKSKDYDNVEYQEEPGELPDLKLKISLKDVDINAPEFTEGIGKGDSGTPEEDGQIDLDQMIGSGNEGSTERKPEEDMNNIEMQESESNLQDIPITQSQLEEGEENINTGRIVIGFNSKVEDSESNLLLMPPPQTDSSNIYNQDIIDPIDSNISANYLSQQEDSLLQAAKDIYRLDNEFENRLLVFDGTDSKNFIPSIVLQKSYSFFPVSKEPIISYSYFGDVNPIEDEEEQEGIEQNNDQIMESEQIQLTQVDQIEKDLRPVKKFFEDQIFNGAPTSLKVQDRDDDSDVPMKGQSIEIEAYLGPFDNLHEDSENKRDTVDYVVEEAKYEDDSDIEIKAFLPSSTDMQYQRFSFDHENAEKQFQMVNSQPQRRLFPGFEQMQDEKLNGMLNPSYFGNSNINDVDNPNKFELSLIEWYVSRFGSEWELIKDILQYHPLTKGRKIKKAEHAFYHLVRYRSYFFLPQEVIDAHSVTDDQSTFLLNSRPAILTHVSFKNCLNSINNQILQKLINNEQTITKVQKNSLKRLRSNEIDDEEEEQIEEEQIISSFSPKSNNYDHQYVPKKRFKSYQPTEQSEQGQRQSQLNAINSIDISSSPMLFALKSPMCNLNKGIMKKQIDSLIMQKPSTLHQKVSIFKTGSILETNPDEKTLIHQIAKFYKIDKGKKKGLLDSDSEKQGEDLAESIFHSEEREKEKGSWKDVKIQNQEIYQILDKYQKEVTSQEKPTGNDKNEKGNSQPMIYKQEFLEFAENPINYVQQMQEKKWKQMDSLWFQNHSYLHPNERKHEIPKKELQEFQQKRQQQKQQQNPQVQSQQYVGVAGGNGNPPTGSTYPPQQPGGSNYYMQGHGSGSSANGNPGSQPPPHMGNAQIPRTQQHYFSSSGVTQNPGSYRGHIQGPGQNGAQPMMPMTGVNGNGYSAPPQPITQAGVQNNGIPPSQQAPSPHYSRRQQ